MVADAPNVRGATRTRPIIAMACGIGAETASDTSR